MDYASPFIPSDKGDIAESYVATRYPLLGLGIACVYLLLVKIVLPKYMEHREPYQLKTVLRIYDVVQVYLNALLVVKFLDRKVFWDYWNIHCVPTPSDYPLYVFAVDSALMYVYLKIIDLLDTVFIVLKKKTSQLSFLHLFHHTMVLSIAYISFSDKEKFGVPIAVLNCFVHAVMYSYYFVASFKSQKWISEYKKHVTQLQLSQFGVGLVYLVYGLVRGCAWGRNSKIMWIIFLAALIYEFSKFYYHSYVQSRTKKDN